MGRILFGLLLFIIPFIAFADNSGNSSGFSWSEKIGWIHFSGEDASIDYGIQVTNDQVSGYVWSEKTGWISLNCLNSLSCGSQAYGVVSDGTGNLSGYAWSEKAGWINFNGVGAVEYQVEVDSSGNFSGYAWSEKIGWINMNDVGDYYGVATGEDSAYCEICSPCNPPVLYWAFNEGAGTTAHDESVRGNNINNDGTLTNGPLWQEESSCLSQKCLSFDGIDDNVNRSYDTDLSFKDNGFSVGTWFKSSAVSTVSYLASRYDTAGWKLWLDSDGDVCFGIDDDSTWTGETPDDYICTSDKNYDDDSWHYVLAKKDATNGIYIFIDGLEEVSDVTLSATGSLSGSAPVFYVGTNSDGTSSPFSGFLDEFKIYEYARTADQIKQDYNAGLAGVSTLRGSGAVMGGSADSSSPPVGYWKFDEGFGGTAHDESGNGNNGTLSAGGGGTAIFTAKSVILDIADNWGDTNFLGLRSVDFWSGGSKISLAATDFTAYATSEFSSDYYAENVFDTSLSKTGTIARNEWYSANGSVTNQRLIVVFDSSQTFDGIRINNSHDSGSFTNRGAKNVVIHYSTDSITDTTYNASISNSTEIFDGQFDEHVASDVEDEQTLTLTGGASVAGGTNTTTTAMWDKGGKYNGACKFDGTDDSVAISDFQFPSSNQFSISKWINVQTLATAKPIVSQWGGSQNNILIKTDDSNSDELRICVASSLTDACTNYAYTTDANLSVSSWKHLNIVYDGSQSTNATKLKLFVNGIQKTLTFSGTIPATIQTGSTSALEIGGNSSLSAYLSAILDEVKIFDYALTAEQVAREYNGGAAVMMGSSGTDSATGEANQSSSGKYCVPGDTSTCNPPVGEWTFGENVFGAGQTLYDTSGNGNNGTTYSANGTGMNCTQPGKVGYGCQFDGTDDSVAISNFQFSTSNQFSISKWINAQTLATAKPIVSQWGGSQNNILIKTDDSNSDELRICVASSLTDACTNYAYTTDANLTVSSWKHLNIVYDGSQSTNATKLKFFLNGIQKTLTFSGTIPATIQTTSTADLEVGGNSNLAGYFDGLVDDFRIYNYARTPAQIAWEYNKGKPMAEWRMDEGTGTTLHDETDGGNDGTLTNMDPATDWVDGKYGKALDFDGVDDYISIGDTGLNTHSLSFWAKQDYTDNYFLDLDGGTHTVTLSGGTVTATGFSSPTIYVDGVTTTTLPDNAWHHITITTTTAIDTNNLNIGKVGTNYFEGSIDNLKLYNYPLTASQVKTDHNNGVAVNFSENSYQSAGSALLSSWSCGDSIQDSEGNSYSTQEIGTQCWMAENMRTIKYPDGSDITKGDVAHGDADWGTDQAWYSCPPNTSNNGEDCSAAATLGMLYQWSAAMNGSALAGAQGICPTGWHLPTDSELYTLESYLATGTCTSTRTGYECDPAGSKLAGNVTDQTWASGTLSSHTDFGTSGFDAPASGNRYTTGGYGRRSLNAYFWSSSESGVSAWSRLLNYNYSAVYRYEHDKARGLSVRCLKD